MDDVNASSGDDDDMDEDWTEGKTLVDNLKHFGIECVGVSVPGGVVSPVATWFLSLLSALATATMR